MRLFPYLGVLAALLAALFVASFRSGTAPAGAPPASTSSLAVLSPVILPPVALDTLLPALAPAAEPAAASTAPARTSPPARATPPPAPAVAAPPAAQAVQAPPPAPAASGNAALDAAAAALRGALVNIVCYSPAGSSIRSISGSGVIVDPRGIILTNAHVAQYFLLGDRGVSCSIRTGSPAADRYRAALMFISPAWVKANSAVITEAQPAGDGEHDYAFLAITAAAPGATLPSVFPFLALANDALNANDPVVIGSYGAQFLQMADIQSDLYPTIVFGSVKAVYTFATDTVDIISLGGSAAAQEGSSGGGVVGASGTLGATITTSTVEGATATRDLDAITAAYVRRSYIEETGTSLETLFASAPAAAAQAFAPHIPALEALITAHLPN